MSGGRSYPGSLRESVKSPLRPLPRGEPQKEAKEYPMWWTGGEMERRREAASRGKVND